MSKGAYKRLKPALEILSPIRIHHQPLQKLAHYESPHPSLGNPKNHTSAKVVLDGKHKRSFLLRQISAPRATGFRISPRSPNGRFVGGVQPLQACGRELRIAALHRQMPLNDETWPEDAPCQPNKRLPTPIAAPAMAESPR